MTVTADQLLTAIKSGDLDTKVLANGEQFAIAIMIDQTEVARVGCLHIERPSAKVSHDGRSVDVFPSHGMPDGFLIPCRTHEDAIVIAKSLEDCLETSHRDLLDGGI